MNKKIRGLRRCTQRDCMLPLNRDNNGAANIATNFLRLMRDEAPIRSMTAPLCVSSVTEHPFRGAVANTTAYRSFLRIRLV